MNKSNEENEEIEETIEINYLDLSEYYSLSEEDKDTLFDMIQGEA